MLEARKRMTTLAIDIGGTKIACGLVQGAQVRAQESVPTPSQDGPEAIMDAAWVLASRVARNGDDQPARLAVASAGVIDPVAGLVTSATNALKDWAGTDLRTGLATRSGLPTTVLNDVHAHALGEFVHGAGRDHRSMLLVAIGTGIGGGFIFGDQIHFGAHDVAGHIGHIDAALAADVPCPCGGVGHVESVASGTGIENCFERADGRRLSGVEIAELAQADEPDPTARQVMDTAGQALGRAIGSLLNAVDPGVVVLAGSVTKAGPTWERRVRESARASAMTIVADTPIVFAQLDNAALVGVAARAEQLEGNHL